MAKYRPIRAYHGSPHSFDAFSANYPNTGTGEQMQGRGLYFTGHPGLGRFNQDLAARTLHGLDSKDAGLLYEVDIDYPEQSFLHYDKPLSEQPHHLEVLRGLLGDSADDTPIGALTGKKAQFLVGKRRAGEIPDMSDDWTEDIQRWDRWKDEVHRHAADALRDAGIPGVQYTATAPWVGQHARPAVDSPNYVLYPGTEQNIRVLRRIGSREPLPPYPDAGDMPATMSPDWNMVQRVLGRGALWGLTQ